MPKGRPKKQQDDQAPNGTAAGQEEGERINKMQCVRDALGEIGNDAQPKDIQDFLKRRFDLDMNTKMISTYKGSILKGKSGKSGVIRQPAARVARESPKVERANGGISVEEIRDVKGLADRLGAEKVRAIMGVLYE